MFPLIRSLAAIAVSSVLSAGLALQASDSTGTIYLTLDNDLVAGSDDGYTNGFQVGYVSPARASFSDGPVLTSVGLWLDGLTPFAGTDRQRFVAYSLAQRMFTPQDISREDLIENDLPYTGLLVFSLTAAAQDHYHLDAVTISAGVAGEASLAKSTQGTIHHALGSDAPKGWDNQIDNEPLLNVQYEHRWRAWDYRMGGTNGDFIVSGSGAAGNIMTGASGGVGLRWGYNVPNDFFVPPPFFGEETVGALPYDSHRAGTVAVYLAASVDASGFANLIYLDGNTFHGSHSVDHDHWFARAHVGLHVHVGRTAFALSIVRASIAWERPDGATWETYGRVSVGWRL